MDKHKTSSNAIEKDFSLARSKVARFLGRSPKQLTYLLYKIRVEDSYETFEISKKSGGTRTIHAPNDKLKKIQRIIARKLIKHHNIILKDNSINSKISHGSVKKQEKEKWEAKGIIANASIHKNKRFVLNIDLSDFFDSFHFGRVKGFFEKNRYFQNFNNLQMSPEIAIIFAQLTCYNGKLPQGAPTSPIITDLICNVFDMRLLKIAKRYKLNYTRYVDDLTFSTNDKKFLYLENEFLEQLRAEILRAGFEINESKIRMQFRNSRQVVTGLTVNKKLNASKDFCKKTRAMAYSLYSTGEFSINGELGTINQLEGRFAFINQLDFHNNLMDMKVTGSKKKKLSELNIREKQYQNFLFYKYFFNNEKPLVITEGKTDIRYLKSALKSFHCEYPSFINDKLEFDISFLNRTRRLKYFLNIKGDGADVMKNILNFFTGKQNYPNLWEEFNRFGKAKNPVILVFDNEINSKKKKPLREFINYVKNNVKGKSNIETSISNLYFEHIVGNLFVLTHPLVKGEDECEIEDLFDNSVLEKEIIVGKSFHREPENPDDSKYYGKEIFSKYVYDNYSQIDFSSFKPMLDALNELIEVYKTKS
ncbi:MAG: retron Ec67 family RNA-directed DNA polymerase/endonuclease [Defluviitaleaceae bacterium]|nr:retron Ec67 family RNA-directed DNA polymerase/endonuclease [Defluviitaleaceae bacterium]